MKIILSVLFTFLILLLTDYARADEIPLSGLTPVTQETGWGKIEPNKSIIGGPLLINGKKYEHGIGLHAPGKLVYEIPENAKYFTVIAGLNDSAGPEGKVEIRISVGSGNSFRLIAKSPILHVAENNKIYKFTNLEVRKSPADQLLRIVVDNLESLSNDHVNICEGVFYTTKKQNDKNDAPTETKITNQKTDAPIQQIEKTVPPNPVQEKKSQPEQTQKTPPQLPPEPENTLETVIKNNLSIYFHTGKIIAIAIRKTSPEIMNLPIYDPSFAIKESEAAYVMIQFLPDKGRTIAQCDYVLIDENGDKFPCIALRSNNKTFDAGKWMIKTTLDTTCTMLFKVNHLSSDTLNFALHFNLPSTKTKDISIDFTKK